MLTVNQIVYVFLYTHYLVVTCRPPETITFGIYEPVPITGSHDYNTSVNYTCDFGYEHTAGDMVRRCDEHAQWVDDAPTCTSKLTLVS